MLAHLLPQAPHCALPPPIPTSPALAPLPSTPSLPLQGGQKELELLLASDGLFAGAATNGFALTTKVS